MDKEAIMKIAKEKGISYEEMKTLLAKKDEEQDPGKGEQDDDVFTQSEMDRRISQAVETNSKRLMKELEAKKQEEIEQARNEAEEYAKLTQKEREEADLQKMLEEIESREKALQNQELRAQITADLQEHSLPGTLADALIPMGDNEKIRGAIKELKETLDKQINQAVEAKLAQDTPPGSGSAMSDDPFAKRIKRLQGK